MNFQQSLFQSSVSHDPSEIILICWFGDQEALLLLAMLNCINSFVKTKIFFSYKDTVFTVFEINKSL